MGDSNRDERDQFPRGVSRIYCQRVRFVDGDYGADGTYWGGGARYAAIVVRIHMAGRADAAARVLSRPGSRGSAGIVQGRRMSGYSERDARAIIRAYYGPDFKYRLTAGCTIGTRPVHDTNLGLPTLVWRKLATGNGSAVAIGQLTAGGGVDWAWSAESRQLSQVKQPAAAYWREYDRRCLAYEAQGMTRSDAQGCVDVEYPMPADMRP